MHLREPALVDQGDRVRTGRADRLRRRHRPRQRLPPALRGVERAGLVLRRLALRPAARPAGLGRVQLDALWREDDRLARRERPPATSAAAASNSGRGSASASAWPRGQLLGQTAEPLRRPSPSRRPRAPRVARRSAAWAASYWARSASSRACAEVLAVAGSSHGVYSHSIVPGGLDVMSSTTRLTSRTSLIMREAICSSRSYGSLAQSAVIASSEVTARIATT